MKATLFRRPHGRREEIEVARICDEDAKWFEENKVKISLEDLGINIAVYADCGFRCADLPDEDPDELIELSNGRSCEETMTALRISCQEAINTGRKRFT